MKKGEAWLKCKDVNSFRLVDYLASIGIIPKYIKGEYYWYLNPLGKETKPSFRVNDRINRWKNFADGQTGSLIDFAIQFHHCTIGEFLGIINGNLSFQKPFIAPPPVNPNSPEELKKKITVIKVLPLYHPALLTYIKERRVSQKVADRYCRQVHFSLYEKERFAIGFKNNLGGYELRNAQFKGSSSPKGITTIHVPGATAVDIIEGFFSMMSLETMLEGQERTKDLLVLNSLSFFEGARTIMERYQEANLFLDNNPAGKKTTAYACSLSTCYKDHSSLYANHEDLNDFICHFGNVPRERQGISI